MRKRNGRKRQAIIDAAYGLFREKGFEKTSVSDICARAGGSKATIYSYFDSKEKLFVECMFSLSENYLLGIFSDLQCPADDLPEVLQGFGKSYLRLACSPEMVSARRTMIAEAGRAGIGKLLYEKLLCIRRQMTSFLSSVIAEGKLRNGDADLAAGQLRALLEMELFEPLLLCAGNDYPDEPAIASATERAVGAFLKAYARDAR